MPRVESADELYIPRTDSGSRALGDVSFVSRARQRTYSAPVEIIAARELNQVVPALERIDRLVEGGRHAAGYLAYESASAFDPALTTHAPGPFPLLWFGIYDSYTEGPRPEAPATPPTPQAWRSLIDHAEYDRALHRIREWLAAGDTYQVNYTFPTRAAFDEDPLELFRALCASQPSDYSAYLDTGRYKILSSSPELFFRLEGDRLTVKPMKGTAPRGLWCQDDREKARDLQRSEKERAENVMIVDLLRSDLGRIARTGSVTVDSLFDIEQYDTLWQMTSTISSRTDAKIPEIFHALFPSGSVTGAPKVRTMELIRDLEPQPRGAYCGSIGWIAPGRQAEFNVAIRTVTIDTENGEAVYPIGSAVTWDSVASAEFDECRLKAKVLTHARPDFELLESILWDGEYFLLDEHIQRLTESARYFGVPMDAREVRRLLTQAEQGPGPARRKVRLRISTGGVIAVDIEPASSPKVLSVGFAAGPIDSTDPFLYHKTTNRVLYDTLRAGQPHLDDVLLWNERGEVTESTIANIVIQRDGRWVTPPVECGLLPGVMRAHLLRNREITEGIIRKEDLREATKIRLINSVRKWIDLHFVDAMAA